MIRCFVRVEHSAVLEKRRENTGVSAAERYTQHRFEATAD